MRSRRPAKLRSRFMARAPRVVTLTTDFGLADSFVGTMKGVILSRCPGAAIVDICHDVPAQNVRVGAMRLASAVPYFPRGSVHVAIVDPGVGGPRRAIALTAGGQAFVGPDNGVLSLAVSVDRPDWRAVELTASRYWLPEVSRTFHGRDVFAPVAAHLASGGVIDDLGPPVRSMAQIMLPQPTRDADLLHGVVLDIDRFGNLITNVHWRDLNGRRVERVVVGETEIPGLNTHYDPSRRVVATISSDGWVEIAVPGERASDRLGVGVEASVDVLLRPG
ncbi:MAG: hypothetical protein GEU73_07470 [Chloroflexi bacterium]|nr:hypothetical protein [Chloroflexota bacterium]